MIAPYFVTHEDKNRSRSGAGMLRAYVNFGTFVLFVPLCGE
jgi:hypothetical protein